MSRVNGKHAGTYRADKMHAVVAKLVEEKTAPLRDALVTIRDGFDHDEDAHKYGTVCRCCLAESVLRTSEARPK